MHLTISTIRSTCTLRVWLCKSFKTSVTTRIVRFTAAANARRPPSTPRMKTVRVDSGICARITSNYNRTKCTVCWKIQWHKQKCPRGGAYNRKCSKQLYMYIVHVQCTCRANRMRTADGSVVLSSSATLASYYMYDYYCIFYGTCSYMTTSC